MHSRWLRFCLFLDAYAVVFITASKSPCITGLSQFLSRLPLIFTQGRAPSSPTNLPAVTHILHLCCACNVTSWRCDFVWASARKIQSITTFLVLETNNWGWWQGWIWWMGITVGIWKTDQLQLRNIWNHDFLKICFTIIKIKDGIQNSSHHSKSHLNSPDFKWQIKDGSHFG